MFLRGWLRKYDRCRSCGIAWRREEGFELGAMTLNTILTFIVVVSAMGVWMVLTAPDIPVLPMVLAIGVLAVLAPLFFFPFSFTLWLVFDLAARPPEADELAAAREAVTPERNA